MMPGFRAIFRTLTTRYYRREQGRFWLCIAGLSAGVAVAGAINLTNSRVIESFNESVETLAGNSNLRVSDDLGFAPEQLEQLRFLWDYGPFTPYVQLDGALLSRSANTADADSSVNQTSGAAKTENRAIVLFGFDFTGASRIRGLTIRKPTSTAADRQSETNPPVNFASGLVVPAGSILGKPGDTVRLMIGGRVQDFLIAGELENINGRYPPLNTAYLDLTTALRLSPGNRLSGIDVRVAPENLELVRPRLAEIFPGALIQTVSERQKITSDMLAAFQMNLQALGIVALLVSAYLVYNTINISVIQRESLIGSLLSLGATPRQIFAALILEGLWLGAIGGVVGLAFGYGLSLIASREVDLTLEAVFRLDAVRSDATGMFSLVVSFIFGLGFSALAAWVPAYRGSRVPVASLRRRGRSEFRPRVLWLGAIGCVVFFIIFWICFALAVQLQSPAPGYGSVAALVGILSMLAPLAIYFFARLAGLFRRSGPARLAAAAAREHLVKLTVAVAALGIALSMAGAVSVMVHSFRTTVINWLDTTVIADIYIRAAQNLNGELDPQLVPILRAHPAVAEALTIRSTERIFRGQLIHIGANEFAIAEKYRPLSFVEGDASSLAAARRQGGVLVSEVFANRFGLSRGDQFTLTTRDAPFQIFGVYRSYASERGFVLMDVDLFQKRIEPNRAPAGVALYLKKTDAANAAVEPATVIRELRDQYADAALDMSLSTEIRGQAIRIFNQTFRLTYILQMIAGGIAALSVITTLTGLALERRREFATLQALGARPELLDRAMAYESQIIAWGALLIALPGSVLLSVLLIHVINRYSFGWTIITAVPYADLTFAALAITVLALGAALVPIRLIRKQNIARILKQE